MSLKLLYLRLSNTLRKSRLNVISQKLSYQVQTNLLLQCWLPSMDNNSTVICTITHISRQTLTWNTIPFNTLDMIVTPRLNGGVQRMFVCLSHCLCAHLDHLAGRDGHLCVHPLWILTALASPGQPIRVLLQQTSSSHSFSVRKEKDHWK